MNIPGVVVEQRGIDHEDERRAILTAFNGDLEGFRAAQVKFAKMHQDALLGGHYHDYRELFYMWEGEAVVTLQSVDDPSLTQTVELGQHCRILIPPRVAHKVVMKKGAVLVGCTEVPYTSPQENDHPFEITE